MPFTLAHPAAILPIWKVAHEHTSLSALVIGSLSPDFAYFLPATCITGDLTHSVSGLLWFCVPAGMAAYVIFHLLLKRPMAVLLPDKIFARLPSAIFTQPAWKMESMRIVAVSIFLGACTHIAWDSLTYPSWMDQAFAVPGWTGPLIGGPRIQMHDVLQFVNSVLGLLCLCISISHWVNEEHPKEINQGARNFPIWFRLAIAFFVLAAAAVGAAIGSARISAGSFELVMFHTAVGGLIGAGMPIGIFCMGWHACFLSRHCLRESMALPAQDKPR
jgi:hypothetical protein